MPLNDKQREAVEYIEGPLLVLAGPGTGKTQLLTSKVAYILNNTDARPSNILCLTFTDAGVKAMRERLFSMNVENADEVVISTYHGFGTKILAEYKNYAESFSRALDKQVDPVRQYKVINEILESLPATDIIFSGALLKTLTGNVLSVISEAKSARLTASDLIKVAEDNLKMAATINPICNKYLQKYKRGMKGKVLIEEIYYPLFEELNKFTSDEPIVKNVMPEVNYLVLALSRKLKEYQEQEVLYDEYMAAGGKKSGLPAVKAPSVSLLNEDFKNKYFDINKYGEYQLSNRIANKKLLSVAKIYAAYEKILAESGEFDFDDMIEEAIVALRDDAGFKATLQERYQYILLDEFQDTNPSQFEIVKLLSDYESPAIMAVGDDDQAIYAFQGAMASNLVDFANFYNAKTVALVENYRSTQEILDIGRKMADKIEGSFVKTRKGIDKTLNSVRNTELFEGFSKVPMISELKAEEDKSVETRITRHEFLGASSEYAWVASKINELIKDGVKQKEIAVIVPQHKFLVALLPYLKKYKDINIAYEKRENVLDDEKIKQLTNLCEFIYELSENKNPTHKLLEIFSYDFWKLEPLKVMNVIQGKYKDERKVFDFLCDENADESLHLVAVKIAEFVKESFELPLQEFLGKVAGEIGEGLSDDEKFAFYEELEVLNSRLTRYLGTTEKPRLKDFVQFIKDYKEAGATILNTSPYRDNEDAVQLLTVHKSKGLEFDHVFMISVNSAGWGKTKGNNNPLTLPKNLEQIRHTGISDDEKLRSLFVAMTRARGTLTMTNSVSDFMAEKAGRLEYLNEYVVAESGEIVSPLLPNTNVIEHFETDEIGLEEMKTQWLSHYFVPKGDLRERMRGRFEKYKLSATDLTGFIDVVYAGPLEFYRSKILRAPRNPDSEQVNFGNLLHATFEKVTNGGISNEDAIKFFEEELEKTDATDDEKRRLHEKGIAALEKSLVEFSEILRGDDKKRLAELDFREENLEFKGVPITGKIDHINIDENEKTIEIYDFKTSGYVDKKWTSHKSLYKYALQLSFYKLLLEKSVKYQNYKVTKGHVLFVCPDADGEVYDKEYDFELDETLKRLVVRVYDEMKKMDFLDEDSPLHRYSDRSLGIKDLKEFVGICLGDICDVYL